MIKKNKWPLMLVLVLFTGAFFVYDHFYQRGIRALVDFSASYDRFEKAISALSAGAADVSNSKVEAALADLKAKATFRLSSLIRNDGELMNQAREVADLAERELATLEACRRASRDGTAGGHELARESSDLAGRRKAAFARFRELGGSKD